MRLHPCSHCSRHVDVSAAACPFCGAQLTTAPAPPSVLVAVAGRVSRAAVFAGLSACWTTSSTPSMSPPPPPPPTADAAVGAQPVDAVAAVGTAALSGTVLDAQTKSPLAYAAVEIRNANGKVAATSSDERGAYTFEKLAPGDYEIVVRFGSASQSGSAQQPVRVFESPARVDIQVPLKTRVPVAKPYGAPPARRRVV